MYIPLFNQTNYTLLSSLIKIEDLIDYSKNNNISMISICDKNMFKTMDFYKLCKANNIKPIIGLNIILKDYEVVLFAKDYIGYKNLIKLSTIQSERKVTSDDLNKYNHNLYCILPFNSKNLFDELRNIYLDLYLGYTNKDEEKEARIITNNIVFFRKNLYVKKEDEKLLKYLLLIRDGKTINDKENYDILDHELQINDINNLSSEEGIENTNIIANNCNIIFPESENLLPIYEISNPEKYLLELCKKGLNKRLNNNIPINYKERLLYEYDVITKMGFANYFLVVYDFIKYAKKNKILVGPGRGSAAGSLVAYSLGITDIDPLKYDLLFERF